MADDSGIDPRHPAQFQRGYDPATPPEAPGTDAPVRPRGPVRLAGGPVATAERVPPPPARRPDTLAAEQHDLESNDPEPTPRTAQWEEWALLVLTVLLVGVAVVVIDATVSFQTGTVEPMDTAEYAWAQIRAGLAGPLLVGAAVSLAAWFAVRAIRRARA